jgi:hypothetical protein
MFGKPFLAKENDRPSELEADGILCWHFQAKGSL